MGEGMESMAPRRAPLWPAGHLPHKGGDQPSLRPSPTFGDWRKWILQPFSPLVGEMAGRPEGGAKERYPSPQAA